MDWVNFRRLVDKMAVDIANWLLGLDLQQYEKAFRDNDIAPMTPTASRPNPLAGHSFCQKNREPISSA